jgi:hypothetical protein
MKAELDKAIIDFKIKYADGDKNSFSKDAKWFFEYEDPKVKNKTTSFAIRSEIRFGMPYASYLNDNDRRKEQIQKYYLPYMTALEKKAFDFHIELKKSIGQDEKSSKMQMFYFIEETFWDVVIATLYSDFSCIVGSVIMVLIILIAHTRSFFLGVMGLIQVLLSFPVCFFLYRIVFGIKLFGALQIISMFIILGIGADDVFILSDALHQSRIIKDCGDDKLKRLSFAVRRAVETMLTTSLTSALAFGSTMISVVPAIKYFGVFTSCLVIVNFTLCCTFYLSSLTIWLQYMEDKPYPCCYNNRKAIDSDLNEIEMSTKKNVALTEKRTDITIHSNDIEVTVENPQVHGKHITSNTTIDIPSTTSTDAANTTTTTTSSKEYTKKKSRRNTRRKNRRASLVSSENLRTKSNRPIELLFHDYIGPFIVRFWKFILLISVLLFIGMSITSSFIRVEEEELYFQKNHRYSRKFDIDITSFTAKKSPSSTFRVVWGIDGIDRTGTDETDERDLGTTKYYPNFDFSNENSQQEIFNMCRDMSKNELKLGIKKRDNNPEVADITCFMAGFKNWRIGRNVSFPAPRTEFVEELNEFMRRPVGQKYQGQVGFFIQKKKLSIKFAWILAKSSYSELDDIALKSKMMSEWDTFLRSRGSKTLGSPYVTGGDRDIFGLYVHTFIFILFDI